MIEIRTLEEDAVELQKFLSAVWRQCASGPVPVPLWSREFLNWQFFENACAERQYMVAAYEHKKLVGCFLAVDGFVWTPRFGAQPASTGSWLTVDPVYRRDFIGPRMIAEMISRHKERGSRGIVGLAFPAGPGASLDFWQGFSRACPSQVRVAQEIGLWVRVLDSRPLVKGLCLWQDRALARIGAWLPRKIPSDPARNVREYRPGDLVSCEQLVHEARPRLDFSSEWSNLQLGQYLRHVGANRTLVVELGERVVGFASFHEMDLYGRSEMRTTILDYFLVAPGTPRRVAEQLLSESMRVMSSYGTCLVIAARSPMVATAPMLRHGFLPLKFGYRAVRIQIHPEFELPSTSRVHLFLR